MASKLWQAMSRFFMRRGRSAPRANPATQQRSDTRASDYPGDFHGVPTLVYAPHGGNVADPGEVVWTWVPYEENYREGKDRPVLIIGRDGPWLLALPLTSQDHDRDQEQEAAEGRHWVEIGRGPWDRYRRVSEVRVNRIVRVDPRHVRRISEKLDRTRFDMVAEAVRNHAS